MSNQRAVTIALELLRDSPEYTQDAREGAPIGNSVVGSLLSLQHQIPRQYGEAAVVEALRILDAEPQKDGVDITLKRTGKAPLRFKGELLEESEGERVGGRENNRWHELAVYRTPGGKYVVRIGYRTRWQGELGRDNAEIVAKPEEVAAVLRDYDPCAPVTGFPPGDAYAQKQARLMSDIRTRYEHQVSELLASSPEFAERVD